MSVPACLTWWHWCHQDHLLPVSLASAARSEYGFWTCVILDHFRPPQGLGPLLGFLGWPTCIPTPQEFTAAPLQACFSSSPFS